jgi:hypothetical protein
MSYEDIQIFSKKSDEHEFLFGIKLLAKTKLLVGVIEVYQNFLVVSPLLESPLMSPRGGGE